MEKQVNLKKGYYLLVREIITNFDNGDKFENIKLLKFDDEYNRSLRYKDILESCDGENDYKVSSFDIN